MKCGLSERWQKAGGRWVIFFWYPLAILRFQFFLEKAISNQAGRIVGIKDIDKETIMTIEAEDLSLDN